MPRTINPTGWRLQQSVSGDANSQGAALVTLTNDHGHRFSVHPLDDRTVHIAHELPARPSGIRLRQVQWENRDLSGWCIDHDPEGHSVTLQSPQRARYGSGLRLLLKFDLYVRLSWYWDDASTAGSQSPFLQDFKRAYPYDAVSGRVWHYVDSEGYMPASEDQPTTNEQDTPIPGRTQFVYGLGEAKGRLNRVGRRFVIDGRDSLGADPTETDPFYKLTPFYIRHDTALNSWHGIYYNTLNPSIFDFGAEHDFSTGNFHYFSTEHGPLDYYVLCGSSEGTSATARPDLPGIVSQFARLVSPSTRTKVGSKCDGWQASSTLPALNQFGYLASSLTLSERADAQTAVVEYVREARQRGFAIDGMHLSSGYCQDEGSGERQYFHWNRHRYPEPRTLGQLLEGQEACQLIINVKPWLLETHPSFASVASSGGFVRTALDAIEPDVDPDRCGAHGNSRTWHWSTTMGQTGRGSFFDFSSRAGIAKWKQLLKSGVLANAITGVWIDNNEMSTLIDDGERVAGEESVYAGNCVSSSQSLEVSQRMSGWSGITEVGTWGRAALTMGMARATHQALLEVDADRRPVVVTRSAVPGMSAFASGTWSGDNSTTWAAMEWSTRLTLSYGLSFGIGLYGHDIGGFAGAHSPSAELLLRWCQQAAWHTRFTVHSWKEISTTLWMYDEVVTEQLRRIVDWRYRLVPMLYSVYVTDWYRKGWPILRPLLWHHSKDRNTLTQDAQFLLGSHILVAPVLRKNHTSVRFNLPLVVGEDAEPTWWCDWSSGQWYGPDGDHIGRTLLLPAPLSHAHSPFLVRAGGTLVLGPSKMTSTNTPAHLRSERDVCIFPAPDGSSSKAGCYSGQFTLVEDDGCSNAATRHGAMTELTVTWYTMASKVHVSVDTGLSGYPGCWTLSIRLPPADTRALVLDDCVAIADRTVAGDMSSPSSCLVVTVAVA